jgi:hypothetical protein
MRSSRVLLSAPAAAAHSRPRERLCSSPRHHWRMQAAPASSPTWFGLPGSSIVSVGTSCQHHGSQQHQPAAATHPRLQLLLRRPGTVGPAVPGAMLGAVAAHLPRVEAQAPAAPCLRGKALAALPTVGVRQQQPHVPRLPPALGSSPQPRSTTCGGGQAQGLGPPGLHAACRTQGCAQARAPQQSRMPPACRGQVQAERLSEQAGCWQRERVQPVALFLTSSSLSPPPGPYAARSAPERRTLGIRERGFDVVALHRGCCRAKDSGAAIVGHPARAAQART